MALRKLYFVVDCKDDAQKEQVQSILNQISETRAFTGSDVIKIKPMFEKNKGTFIQIFKAISNGGMSGIMKSIPLLTRLKK